MLQYRTDDAFDNTYVDDNLRQLWRNEHTKIDFPKLTPLRNWETDELYQVSSSSKLTKEEVKKAFWRLKETLFFIAITIVCVGVDHSIAKLIDVFKRHGNYGITYLGKAVYFRFNVKT